MSASEIHASFAGNGTDTNPIVSKVGDFTPFYIAIGICSVIFGALIILNVICCCSGYSYYWCDRHSGNRWIATIWSTTPHKQPPLDLSELESQYQQVHYVHPYQGSYPTDDLPPSISHQPLTSSQEYLELHKRESDI